MKQFLLFTSFLSISFIVFSQKLLWTSQTGGTSNNGAIIEYDITNNQVSTLGSLGGNFMKAYNLSLDYDNGKETWNTSGMIMGSDGNLYGVNNTITSDPELLNVGGLYKIDTSTHQLSLLHSFSAYDLHKPTLGLVESSPGVFYGVTTDGGEYGYGGIWKFDSNSGGYSEIAYFDTLASNGIGRYPISPLIKGPNGDVFGVLRSYGSLGSAATEGHLYKIKVANDSVSLVSSLGAAGWAISGPIDQIAYNSSLNKIFGTKEQFTGLFTGGGVYSYNFNTQTVTNEVLITNAQAAVLGQYGHGITNQANDGFHYVLCRSGGANNKGTLLKYNPNGNTIVKVHDFTNQPNGTGITISGTKVMGTYQSSLPTEPLVWSYDVSSTIFTNIITGTNDSTQGYFMSPAFAVNNNDVYGITRSGGPSDAGSVFKHNVNTGITNIIQNNQSTEGRGLIGELTLLNDSIAYAHISSGGTELAPKEFAEQGGLAKVNLLTGSVELASNESGFIELARSHSHKYNKLLISQSGAAYASYYTNSSSVAQANYSRVNLSTGVFSNAYTENFIISYGSGIELTSGEILFALGEGFYRYNETTQTANLQFNNTNVLTEGYFNSNLTHASNGLIYGYTSSADKTDPSNKCVIYSTDSSFNSHTLVKTFDSPVTILNNGLTEVNGKLYGSTMAGGTNGDGFLFSIDITNGAFKIEYSFNKSVDGGVFLGEWTNYNDELYAISYTGGQNGYGTFVKYNATTNTFNVIENLTIDNGRAYRATPALWDDTFLGINERSIEPTINIYPNPAKSVLYIDAENVKHVQVHSVTGVLVIDQFENTKSINIENLDPGMYIIRIENNEGIFSKRFIRAN